MNSPKRKTSRFAIIFSANLSKTLGTPPADRCYRGLPEGSFTMTAEQEDAMTEIDTALAANRDAVEQLIRAGEQSGAAWSTPRAPGKWSPRQIVEHVARGLDEGANIVAGRPTLPRPPAVVRLIG